MARRLLRFDIVGAPDPVSRMASRPFKLPFGFLTLLGVATGLVLTALYFLASVAQPDVTLGIVQKIFYFHVSSAIAMMLCLSAGSVLSLVDLFAPSDRVDALAQAAVETGLTFAVMVLTSGPLWARKSWGAWWTWEPRLTLTLMLLLLAVAVLGIRQMATDGSGRKIAAALAALAAPVAYLIHVAVEKWGGTHPMVLKGGGIQSADMQTTFRLAMCAILLFAATLVTLRFRVLRLEQRLRGLELEISAQEVRRSRQGEHA